MKIRPAPYLPSGRPERLNANVRRHDRAVRIDGDRSQVRRANGDFWLASAHRIRCALTPITMPLCTPHPVSSAGQRERVMSLPSAYEVALLVVLNVDRYAEEKGRGVARARMARKTLSDISGRTTFKTAFLNALEEELDALGWILIAIPDGFAILEHSSLSGWTKISKTRIVREITGVKSGKTSPEELEAMLADRSRIDEDEGE